MVISVLVTAIVGYLLGNLNGAVLISRLVAKDDVRNHGSGNAGFTNFYRNYGGWGALAVLAIDFFKAYLACWLGKVMFASAGLTHEGMMLGALAVALGHDFPALMGFKGGKGIVCGFASAAAIHPLVALILVGLFFLVWGITKYVSLASLVVSVSFGLIFAWMYRASIPTLVMSLVIAILAIYMHRGNIQRLLKGEERKTTLRKKVDK